MTGNFSSNFNSAGAFAQNRKAHGTDPDHSCGRLREVETNARATPIKVGFVLLSNSRNPLPSTRIAGLNMFPFLPLDGGHVLWSVAEKVRGRRISLASMYRFSSVGIILLVFLVLNGLSNDIGRLAG